MRALAVILLFALPCMAQTTPSTQNFEDPDHRIRLKYPANWSSADKRVKDVAFAAATITQAPTDPRGVVSLSIRTPATAPTIDALAQQVAESMKKQGATDITTTDDHVGPLAAKRIRFKRPTKEGQAEMIFVLALRGQTMYLFNYGAPPEAFELYLPQAESILRSIELVE